MTLNNIYKNKYNPGTLLEVNKNGFSHNQYLRIVLDYCQNGDYYNIFYVDENECGIAERCFLESKAYSVLYSNIIKK